MAQLQKSGQQAVVYISPLAAEIARAKHRFFFSAKRDTILIDGGLHLPFLQAIDRMRAKRQQSVLRKLQKQAVAIGTWQPGHSQNASEQQHAQFDTACRAYFSRRADHEILLDRMAARRARFAPVI